MVRTVFFDRDVAITQTSSIAGPKEGEGPLKKYYDYILKDDIIGQKSHEHAEIMMQLQCIKQLLNKAHLSQNDVDCVFGGDLLDEIIGCNFAMRELEIPFIGLYNACATFGEALILGAIMIHSDYMSKVITTTTSHYATAERQYRFPLELGSQRTPLSQWTVTGAGCSLLTKKEEVGVKVTSGTIGKVVDYGVSDANDMGAVMAPAALNTIVSHLSDTGRDETYYDLIVTGDLGHGGSRLLQILAKKEGLNLGKNYSDCGILIFNREGQDVGQGGSGACCSNLVFNAYLYKMLSQGTLKKILFVPTGALLSKVSSLQGETIPAIAHAVAIEVV
ncbi:MAG: stage V sporulation protein AD [Clostridia bacterium]|nr:stage V sporulation protein AD [Clostridia bacterium]